MLVIFNTETGFVTEIRRSTDEQSLQEKLKGQRVSSIILKGNKFLDDDGIIPFHQAKVVDGVVVRKNLEELAPPPDYAIKMELSEANHIRDASEPRPIHVMKYLTALHGDMSSLQAEADDKGISLDDLRDLILKNASETLKQEASFNGKIHGLENKLMELSD